MLDCPYNRSTLLVALATLHRNPALEDEEKMKKLVDETRKEFPSEGPEVNRKIAERNGISVEQLINSSNLKYLTERYQDDRCKFLLEKMQEIFNLTDVEAWAGTMAGTNKI